MIGAIFFKIISKGIVREKAERCSFLKLRILKKLTLSIQTELFLLYTKKYSNMKNKADKNPKINVDFS